MALEFLITGLTGVFLWLFLRHHLAFRKEKILQQAGDLLLEVKTTKTGYYLRLVGQAWVILSVLFMGIPYIFLFARIKEIAVNIFPYPSPIPSLVYVFLEWNFSLAVFLVLSLPIFIPRRRISFTICQAGIRYGSRIMQFLIPWEKIAYGKWSSTKKWIVFQRSGRWRRNRFSVEQYETVSPVLSPFIELRNHRGHILSSPRSVESLDTNADANISSNSSCRDPIKEKRPLRRFPFQFDLLTLLLFTLVVASASSWYAYRNHRAGSQAEAAEKLTEFQPMILYDDVNVKCVWFGNTSKLPHDEDLTILKSFPQLESLSLYYARITDAGLQNLETLTQLRELHLSSSKITDDGLIHLKSLKQLQSLGLWGTKITDRGLHHLKSLTQLEILSVSANGITDAGVIELTSLENLRELTIDGKITDAGLMALKNVKSLRQVRIASPLTSLKAYQELQKALPQAEVRLPVPPNPSPPSPPPATDNSEKKSL
jgi:Leucine-rich repeat (LRR) protein